MSDEIKWCSEHGTKPHEKCDVCRAVAEISFDAPTGSAYRMLKEGEIIQECDYFLDDAGMWRKTICAGQPAPNPVFTAHRQYKRWLSTPNSKLTRDATSAAPSAKKGNEL